MNKIKILLQLSGLLLLLPVVTLTTLRIENSYKDGPSMLFPGGELVAGELYSGAEPDWNFTSSTPNIELELTDSGSSRRMFILNAEGKAYVISGYMNTLLGRLWKHWAVDADQGSGLAVIRIDGVRYERQLQRIQSGDELDGAASSFLRKYGGGVITAEGIAQLRDQIQSGESWVFRLAPRES